MIMIVNDYQFLALRHQRISYTDDAVRMGINPN